MKGPGGGEAGGVAILLGRLRWRVWGGPCLRCQACAPWDSEPLWLLAPPLSPLTGLSFLLSLAPDLHMGRSGEPQGKSRDAAAAHFGQAFCFSPGLQGAKGRRPGIGAPSPRVRP